MSNIITITLISLNIITIILTIVLLNKNRQIETKLNNQETKEEDIKATIAREMSNTKIEIETKLSNLESRITQNITNLTDQQIKQLNQNNQNNTLALNQVMQTVDKKLEDIRQTVDQKLRQLQQDNNQKLNEIKTTVDEKLHKTLEEKLGESFKQVSLNLEQVHKGLGEMQSLAQGVGDLKKVLSNVKTRGIMGEIQLEAILEQILSPEQYVKNAHCKPNTQETVEFAVKLPGKTDKPVLIPIDSKFPIEAYHRLVDAHENMNKEEIQQSKKELEQAIRKSAKDISEKYINPPDTTEFAIMFLPTEGLYAEIVRNPDLLSKLQTQNKVIIAGPTTFAALLNSLQLGFQTLAIQKRSSQVWETLTRVRDEFNKFGEVLEKAQKKLVDAGTEIDKLVGIRSKKIIQQLEKIGDYSEIE